MLSESKTVFFLCFQSVCFFSFLLALTGTSNMIVGKSGARGHCCLVPDLSGETFSLSPLVMILPIGLCRYPLLG